MNILPKGINNINDFQVTNLITNKNTTQSSYNDLKDYNEFTDIPISEKAKVAIKKNKTKPQNLNKSINELKTKTILKEFKKLLKETEEATNSINKRNQTLNEEIDDFSTNSNYLNNKTFMSNLSLNDIKQTEDIASFVAEDEVTRLKISNEVLIKSNLDLKNKNKILQNEINQYKNSAIYKSPYSQFDNNLNEFIQDLKNSLDNGQISNNELQEIIKKVQESNEKLTNSNNDLIHSYEITKEEFERATKENSELKARNDIKEEKNKELNNKINEMENIINDLQNDLLTKEKQIKLLQTMDNSSKLTQKDNEEIINNLKDTIENLQKNSQKYDLKINELNQNIENLEDNIKTKINEINALKVDIKNKEDELKEINIKIPEYEKIINDHKSEILKGKNDIQIEIFEKEKLKAEIESLNLYLKDREKTIKSLKSSIAFLSKTFDNDLKSKSSSNILNNNNSENNIIKENSNEVYENIIENLQNQIKKLKEKNLELEEEKNKSQLNLNEYVEQFEQIKYDYQLLFQKYKEQNSMIDNLKNEFMNKRKDKELLELIHQNQEITQKLQKMQEANELKNKELEMLKNNYERVNQQFKPRNYNDIDEYQNYNKEQYQNNDLMKHKSNKNIQYQNNYNYNYKNNESENNFEN
jgi:chromosome segregation ATPase